ncbi:MAG: hypothetical protein EYC68_12505 [Chloroflexota bacterium]|nr:MAG: hypothetical protein EYC68_12505 [Chloroflexota bacterium]
MAQAVSNSRPAAQQTRRGFPINLHEGWIAGVLLTVMLVSVTASVQTANWVDGLGQAVYAVLGGMLFGALVARLRLNGLFAFLLACIVGTAWVAWLVSWQVGAPPDATWNEKLLLIEERIDEWLVRVLAGGIGTDAFIFLCVMCAFAWFLGYVSAWSVFRYHQPWGAILPCGAALLMNLFYAPPQSALPLMLFLLAALLLLVRTTLLKRQQTWSAYAVRFANDIGLDFLVYGVIFSGLIILLAWLIPPTAPGPAWFGFIWERVREPWQEMQDDMTRAFSTVRGTNNAAPTTFFGSSLTMGGPIRLGDRDVFEVDSPYGRYWRVIVFDEYNGVGWGSSTTESANFVASDPRIRTMPMEKRRAVTQTVEIRLPTDNLVVSASQPVQVSLPVTAKFLNSRGGGAESFLDLVSLRLQAPAELGMEYTVVSSVSAADEKSLRAASTQIPAFIRNHYLDLPASVPARVKNLAMEITADAPTNYDKARAIEKYLREHIKYNADVDSVPEGHDGVDYVLFERPEGYCNYYASAMAVMARAVGIPARVASGYAVGSPSDDGRYHINEANAHSWPELYFGELGWIEFEPTTAQTEITRPVQQDPADRSRELQEMNQDDEPSAGFGERRAQELDQERQRNASASFFNNLATNPLALGTLALFGLVVLGAGTISLVQWRWRKQLKTLKPGAQAAAEMYRFTRFTGMPERADATPDERAAQLSNLMPDARESIADVNRAYVSERYGAQELSPEERAAALASGVAVQKQMWRVTYDRIIGTRLRNAQKMMQDLPQQIEHQLEKFRNPKS